MANATATQRASAKGRQAAYSPEQTAQAIQEYNQGIEIAQIAENLGKSARSVIAKLSREGVYKKAEYTTKNGARPVKKESLADSIGQILGLDEASVTSLSKANKKALDAVLNAISNTDD